MQKIYSYLALFFVFIFSFVTVSAHTIVIPGSNNNIFNEWKWDWKIPYCNNGDCSFEKWVETIKNSDLATIKRDWTAVSYIQDVVNYVLGFLFAITVIFIIWAWVMILTSAWNDDKVEKAKKIIIHAIIWLCVIFLAYPISSFVIDIFTNTKTMTTK